MSDVAEILGCQYPAIQGDMGVISNPENFGVRISDLVIQKKSYSLSNDQIFFGQKEND